MKNNSAWARDLVLRGARVTVAVMTLGSGGVAVSGAQDHAVEVLRVPDGGIQPLAAIDEVGTIHLVYFTGDPMAGDVFYVEKPRDATNFTEPVRVNSQPGSVIATGTVRGAQMALGRDGRVHVAWMGSATARPRGPRDLSPMLYARSTDLETGFETQRNDHDVALLGWDLMDASPNEYDVPFTVHGVLFNYGVALLDNALLEPLAACSEEGRYEFMLMALPLNVARGTGSPVNPIAMF